MSSAPRYRDAGIGACRSASMERRRDGSIVLRSQVELGAFPDTLTQCLDHWAEAAPDRTFIVGQMVDRINEINPQSGADAWRELRREFPDSPLALRVTALEALMNRLGLPKNS